MSKKADTEKEYKKLLKYFKVKHPDYSSTVEFTLSKNTFETLVHCIAEIKIKNRYLRKQIKVLKGNRK